MYSLLIIFVKINTAGTFLGSTELFNYILKLAPAKAVQLHLQESDNPNLSLTMA